MTAAQLKALYKSDGGGGKFSQNDFETLVNFISTNDAEIKEEIVYIGTINHVELNTAVGTQQFTKIFAGAKAAGKSIRAVYVRVITKFIGDAALITRGYAGNTEVQTEFNEVEAISAIMGNEKNISRQKDVSIVVETDIFIEGNFIDGLMNVYIGVTTPNLMI